MISLHCTRGYSSQFEPLVLLQPVLMFCRLLLLLMVYPHLSGPHGDASSLTITPPVIGRA